jgi:hypothetical protein
VARQNVIRLRMDLERWIWMLSDDILQIEIISDIIWGMLRRRMDDVYWDTFYDVENLVDYWEDDRIDRLLISYDEWLVWPEYN